MEKNRLKSSTVTDSIYSDCIFTEYISIPITLIGKNEKDVLLEIAKKKYEGKCFVHGYVKPNSMKLLTISSGKIDRGSDTVFSVSIHCHVCLPVEGMIISCKATKINKSGILAEIPNENPSPLVIFISRDHQVNNDLFQNVKEDDIIKVKIIGQKFELFDTYVSVIGEIV